MAKESLIQVAADGVGKKVRNLSAYVIQSDDSVALVQMQVVALADETGKLIDLDFSNRLEELVRIGRQQRFLLRLLLMQVGTNDSELSDDDLSAAADRFI